MLSLKSFIVLGLIFRSLVNFELICIYSVGNLSLLFCELLLCPVLYFSSQIFFSQIFNCSLYCIFVIYVSHLFFRDDE